MNDFLSVRRPSHQSGPGLGGAAVINSKEITIDQIPGASSQDSMLLDKSTGVKHQAQGSGELANFFP